MGVCDDLVKKDLALTCDDPITPGLEQEGIIINRKDVDFAASTFNTTRKNVLETLALKAQKKGYKIQVLGSTPYTGTNTALAAGTYRNTFTHTVAIVVLANDPDVCADIIDGLANGEFVVILENKHKGLQKEENAGDSAFQVYGWYNGLKASEISNDKYAEETDGGWSISLQETKVPKSALFLFKTDYDTTKTAVDTLTTEPE